MTFRDPSFLESAGEVDQMNDLFSSGRRMAMYVCRGCGYECANKGAYRKCPVCGIHWG